MNRQIEKYVKSTNKGGGYELRVPVSIGPAASQLLLSGLGVKKGRRHVVCGVTTLLIRTTKDFVCHNFRAIIRGHHKGSYLLVS
jgi:hypothetical protein